MAVISIEEGAHIIERATREESKQRYRRAQAEKERQYNNARILKQWQEEGRS